MTLLTPALRMTVFVGETDQVHHRPLYTEIVHRAHARGLAGATVLHGCEGYGASSKIHTTRILSLAEGLPVVIVIVDTPERIRAFVPEIEDLVPEGLITLDEVEVVGSVGRAGRDTPRGQDGEGPPIDVRSPRPGADRERR